MATRKKEIDYNNLKPGEVIELMGSDLANVRYVRSKQSEKPRKDGEEPMVYHHFSIGGRGWTIDSGDQESADLLKDRANRANLGTLTLEATEHQVPMLDDDLQPTGETETRKSFRFISVTTAEEAKAYARNEGQIKAEELKWLPKDNTATLKELEAVVGNVVDRKMATYQPAAAEALED